MMKHIMAAIDGSECSFRALEHAAHLAKGLNARLTILIVSLFIVGRRDVYVVLDDSDVKNIKKKANEIVEGVGNLDATILVEKSRDVGFTIVDTSIVNEADLIVMGASGKGGFKTFLLGSVSKEVLRKSACPVTIVH